MTYLSGLISHFLPGELYNGLSLNRWFCNSFDHKTALLQGKGIKGLSVTI